MPIYEYECTSCGHRFEKMLRIGAEPPPCPECAAAVRKLISQSAFILKGGGWYKDHYGLKSDSGGGGKEASKADSTKSDTAATAKSEGAKSEGTKSETKSEAAKPATAKSEPAKAATPSTAAK